MTDDRITAIARTLKSGKGRTSKLAALQVEHGFTESAARSRLRFHECSSPKVASVYENAETLVTHVNHAESDLTEASTSDLAATIAARFA